MSKNENKLSYNFVKMGQSDCQQVRFSYLLGRKKFIKKFRFEGNAIKLKRYVEQCQGYLPMVKI